MIASRGLILAPLYFTVRYDGFFTGLAVSAVNHIKGEHRGLTIGLVNIADRLEGFQLGLINIARSNRPGLRVLPLVNLPIR